MFPEFDSVPYKIIETHESVRYNCPRLRSVTPAVPLLKTDSDINSDRWSFRSVPSDLGDEWQNMQEREAESPDSSIGEGLPKSGKPSLEPDACCHAPGVPQPSSEMSLRATSGDTGIQRPRSSQSLMRVPS
ncbi:hypothetical protein FALCPG4_013303 [Fusarium falciforme]